MPRLDVRLSEDGASASLNDVAHAIEHCAVDARTLDALHSAVGRQVLVRTAPDHVALFTATEMIRHQRTVHAGSRGIDRLTVDADAGDGVWRDASIQTDFTHGSGGVRLNEELLGNGAARLAILAPHGGLIERGTDHQAVTVHDELARRSTAARAWIARGFNPVTGAHTCWHITSSEIAEQSFPKLARLVNADPYEHAVAFHGHVGAAVIVGGGLPRSKTHTAHKHALASAIRKALQRIMRQPPKVEVRLSGELAGALGSNIVNRVAVRGNGIQIEQPLSVRQDQRQRLAVAQAVAGFYADLLR